MKYFLNGIDITDKQFIHNEITYPINWLSIAKTEDIISLGIIIEKEPIDYMETITYEETPLPCLLKNDI